jgi:hypothetical protein
MTISEELARECRAAIETIQQPTKRNAGDRLAKYGLRFDEYLHESTGVFFDPEKDECWFVPAAAQSLVWSHHAQPSEDDIEEYAEGSKEYIAEGTGPIDALLEFSGPYGKQALRRALDGYRAMLLARTDLFRSTPESPSALKKQQDAVVTGILGESDFSNTHGIGPWLGLGPYKIFLLRQRDWWGDSAIDEILLPLGKIWQKGLRYLAKRSILDNGDVNLISVCESPEGFSSKVEAFGSVGVAQHLQRDLANRAMPSSRTLHINSGLWLLGSAGH